MALCWPLQMPPTQKAVLISLADNANDQGYCWPSLMTISERTCFSKRAVIDAIAWLEKAGAIIADRTNGRHTTYQLKPAEYVQPVQLPHRCSSRTGAPAASTGAAPAPVPVQLPHQPVQQVHPNRKEPSLNRKSNRQLDVTLPDWLPEATWNDWVDHRAAIKRPLSQRAAELTINKLVKLRLAGNDPVFLIETAIESGWQGIYVPRSEKPNANHQPSRKLSAVEQVEQAIRDQFASEPDDDYTQPFAQIGYCRTVDADG